MYPTRWSPPRCAKRPHHCGHVRYKAARLTTCDYHPTQKTYDGRKILNQDFQGGKLLILQSLVGIQAHLMCLQKFFLSSSVQWKDIENLVSFAITCLKRMFHLQNVYLQHRMHNWHQDHLAQHVHSRFPFGSHFVLVKDLHAIELVILDNSNYDVKGHGFNSLKNIQNLWVLHTKISSNHIHIMIDNRFKKKLNTNLHNVHIVNADGCHY